jgi:hypothetical protein
METVFPEQSLLNDGLQFVNFFNGRLLTAEDLTDEQTADRLARRQLGKALGSGVANGFWVTAPKLNDNTSAGLVVDVDAGVATSPRGDVVCLTEKTRVALTGSIKPTGGGPFAFADCDSTGESGISGSAGLYLLTVSPAAEGTGRAPTSGLGGSSGGNTPAPCNTRYVVYGLAFHLIRLTTPTPGARLRNTLAYQAFGFLPVPNVSQTVSKAFDTPFAAASASYGLLDALGPDKLPICNVPLALIYRSAEGLQFVDNWSVRRRVTGRTATQPWHFFTSPRRSSENEAQFLQFQEHLADLLADKSVKPEGLRAAQRFALLPPAGLLPASVDWRTFLGRHAPARPTPVDPGLLADLLGEALDRAPFVVEDTQRPLAAVDVFSTTGLVNPAFVLFARSQQGRIRIHFSQTDRLQYKRLVEKAGDAVYQPSTFTARADESNLQVRATILSDEEAVFPNLAAGGYRVSGVQAGRQPLENRAAAVVGGQITLLEIDLSAPDMPLCLGVEFIEFAEMSNIRMCLVTGTFNDALEQAKQAPWLKMRRLEMIQASTAERLDEWRLSLAAQFEGFEVEASEPQIYVNPELKAPNPPRSFPIIPQAYAVFGRLGIPLTVYAPTNLSRDPLLLTDLVNEGAVATRMMVVPGIVSGFPAKLLESLDNYGIKTVEQVAGAWLNLIREATSLSDKQARELIAQAFNILRKMDA